jgi:hypothetical protein
LTLAIESKIILQSVTLFKKQCYQIPQMWVKYGFGRFGQIRVLPRVKYGFVTVGGENENRVKYGFVTVRDLLHIVRGIRGVRGICILP